MRHTLVCMNKRQCQSVLATRNLSNYVSFTSANRQHKDKKPPVDDEKSTPSAPPAVQKTTYKLRVPLLKSPSHFGHYTSRVNRMTNEDKYNAGVLQLNGRTVFNFNVFDGHGGDQCSTFLQENLSQTVEDVSALVEDTSVRDSLFEKYSKDIGGYWRRWYKQKDANVEKMASAVPQVSSLESIDLNPPHTTPDDLMLRLPMAHLAADYNFFNQEDNVSGSTCTSAYLETIYAEEKSLSSPVSESYFFNRKTVSKLTLAQVGDAQAILVDSNGEAHALAGAHHPSNPIEASRLRRYAASYFMTDSFGEERFISLANTRAFGDLQFKEMGVSAEPDVAQYILGDAETISKKLTADEIQQYTVGGLGGDESFLVLCTDGVTNQLTDQEIADIVMVNFNLRGHLKASPQFCAEEVIKFVEYIGGDDNATCLVIRLNGWGKWPIKDRTGQLRQERLDSYMPRDRG